MSERGNPGEENVNEVLERIRGAYDLTVEQFEKRIDPLAVVPDDFKNLPEFKAFINTPSGCNSADPQIKEYLSPSAGMRFLDAGCSANLANYRLDKWPSRYYGIDISPRLIAAMKAFAERNRIRVGALEVADLSALPFDNDFFDIACVIGVFEYMPLDYIERALRELSRVLEPRARVVMDIPNPGHPHYPLMLKLEEYLARPHIPCTRESFEELLEKHFTIERAADERVMITYFIKNDK